MTLIAVFLIALALAMDAFAVSVASGIAIKKLRIGHAFTIALWFGIFQSIMPLIGWIGGVSLRDLLSSIDHWVIFGLLLFIGLKMIWEAFQIEPIEKGLNPLDVRVLFTLSLATSVDALATGVSFALLGIPVVMPVLIIGAVTFILSFAGVWIGDRSGDFFGKKMEIVAGIILIAIGVKVLISHLAAG
ncbi:MAG: manganese efflux pump [Deltaproteobacteria bacterium]|nr:manganese efflux pump [Deltaproteobacteria bacterium]